MIEKVDWEARAQKGFLASGIDPADRLGHKNRYIDLLQKLALSEVLDLKGDELVLDFGCGSGRLSYWIAPRVKQVVGLEVTQGMIDLAEENRTAGNVEFILYDGVHFPDLPRNFDLILSVGVLQILRGEALWRAVSELTTYLKPRGRFCSIEQVSDNLEINRPNLEEYLGAFRASSLELLCFYPIRRGRWWLLYLIRYGLIPRKWFSGIAAYELRKSKRLRQPISYYWDFLFLLRKP